METKFFEIGNLGLGNISEECSENAFVAKTITYGVKHLPSHKGKQGSSRQ
ncbi:11700_t:CDS:2 [Funneliformis caledonium]|uniref:11700_t:CDS:1 n=1 Tax=Funneliformis caledonium TaxID=1117310 RepID=A0A9N8ZAD2_9GLOM|nr:11700_t:CDS:2 [Funneliformis caledonium]